MPTPHYGQPRYRVIADELRKRIETGAIPLGTLLPTESALTVEFKASRGTVRQAIALLRNEGLAATEPGRGTYVATYTNLDGTEGQHRKVAADAHLAELFGVEIGTPLIERETAIPGRDRAQRVVRVYRLDDTRP